MVSKKNRNIRILKSTKDLKDEAAYSSFDYKEHFHHLCDLKPNRKKERLEVENTQKEELDKKGLVYVMVIEGKIFKIGHTITSMKERVSSYNCGKNEYRINGTCSTTNYYILQSLLGINKKIEIYAFFPEAPVYSVFGEEYQDSYPVPKTAEKKIIKDFSTKHGRKPIGCTTT